MRPESAELLGHVRDAIANVESFVGERDHIAFAGDLLVQHATLWNLAVIGEAVNRLRKIDLPTARRISEWQRIISARNQLTYGYDTINTDITWRIVTIKLPTLRREVDALLAEPDD